jgi:hypothetical protein
MEIPAEPVIVGLRRRLPRRPRPGFRRIERIDELNRVFAPAAGEVAVTRVDLQSEATADAS